MSKKTKVLIICAILIILIVIGIITVTNKENNYKINIYKKCI